MNTNCFKEEKDCCGCTACKQICPQNAIEMQENKKGFMMPVIDQEKCIHCGLCEKVCAFHKKKNEVKDCKVFAVKRKGFLKRMSSQSGGAFSVLAEEMLRNDGCVYGVRLDGKKAYYSRINRKSDLNMLKGSKYVQADMLDIMKQVEEDLNSRRSVLFSGTACHIEGLVSYFKKRNVDVTNLVTCDLICHGVPSPLVYREYYQHLEKRYGEISGFNFRNKLITSWRGCITSFDTNKKTYVSNSFVDMFYSHLVLRQSCFYCPYASTNRISDITIGDFWGIEKFHKEFDDSVGCSVMILNSSKGMKMFDAIKGKVKYLESNREECMQPNLQHPTKKPEMYDRFWEMYEQKGFYAAVKEFCNFSCESDKEISRFHFFYKEVKCLCYYLFKKHAIRVLQKLKVKI